MPNMTRINTSTPTEEEMSSRIESLFLDSSPDFGPVRFDMNKLRPIGEMVQPVLPQSGYRERSSQLRRLDDDRNALIDELISKLESTQQQLNHLHLDRDRETRKNLEADDIRDALQRDLENMRMVLEHNSYVTVIIDGDTLFFEKEHLENGENGGLEVIRLIEESVKRFIQGVWPHLANAKVHVKIFANVRVLSERLAYSKQVENIGLFESFLVGLSSSNTLVDIYDTRLMKGLTMKKLREAYRHDYVNVHCHQIFLAALASEELNDLLNENPNFPVHERVTLLEVADVSISENFHHEIASTKLDVALVKLPNQVASIPPPAKVATPALARMPSTSSTKTTNSGPGIPSATSTPQLSWAAMTAQTVVPKGSESRTGILTPMSMNTPLMSKATPAQVPRNKHGERIDNVDATIPYQELQRIKKMKLCNIYYLTGKGECPGNCGHSHTYPLSRSEKNVLKEVARMTACHNRTECDDIRCIYGHRCPQNKPDRKDCFYKDSCRFSGWGHGIDEKVVKVQNIK